MVAYASIVILQGNVGEEAYPYTMETFAKHIYILLTSWHFCGCFCIGLIWLLWNTSSILRPLKLLGKYPFTIILHITVTLCYIQIMGTDNPFWCPTWYVMAGLANSTSFPMWPYNFDHAASFEFKPANARHCDGHSCEQIWKWCYV